MPPARTFQPAPIYFALNTHQVPNMNRPFPPCLVANGYPIHGILGKNFYKPRSPRHGQELVFNFSLPHMPNNNSQIIKPVRISALLGNPADIGPLADFLELDHFIHPPVFKTEYASDILFQSATVSPACNPFPVVRMTPLHKLKQCVPEVNVAGSV